MTLLPLSPMSPDPAGGLSWVGRNSGRGVMYEIERGLDGI
jgi:hypothetical protein